MRKYSIALLIFSSLLSLAACTTPKQSPLTLPFIAHGNEPGWSITLNTTQDATILMNYGERQFSVPLPAPQHTYAGTHYRSTYQGQDLNIDIIEKPCNDTMSDEVFAYEVLLTIESQQYQGCGRK